MTEAEFVKIGVVVETGPHAGLSAEFTKSPIFIGRAQSNDIRLTNDSTVSGIHAVLQMDKGCWWLKDCGSRNGTFICGDSGRLKVQGMVALSDEQDVFIGSTRLSLATSIDGGEGPSHTGLDKIEETTVAPALTLSIACQEESILYRLGSSSPTVASYSRAYDDTVLDDLDRRLEEAVSLVNLSTEDGTDLHREALIERIKSVGTLVSDRLLARKVVEKMADATGGSLFLSLHPDLIRVPWELTIVQGQPWCLRFDMGRQIVLEEKSVSMPARDSRRAPRLLFVIDPTGDLPESRDAGEALFETVLNDHPMLDASLILGDRVSLVDLLSRLENTDILYYHGHAEHDVKDPANSAWLLKDGRVTCKHFGSLKSPPALVFANACESGKESQWTEPRLRLGQLTGMVSGFLASGVTHYLGTMWPIAPAGGSAFANAFFPQLLQGAAIGSCVRQARQQLIDLMGPESLVWASYVLYGDPTHKFV